MDVVVVKARIMRTGSGFLGLGKKQAIIFFGHGQGECTATFLRGNFPPQNKVGKLHIDVWADTFEFHYSVLFMPRVGVFENPGGLTVRGKKVYGS